MCAGPRAAFARASRVVYGGSSPPATLSIIPGKCYATIQLLTYLYGFQVSRVVPGERPRHQALLSLGGILPRPCRLPPLSPILKTLSQTIPNHTLHLPPTPPHSRTPQRPPTSACSQKSARIVTLVHASPRQQPQLAVHMWKRPHGILRKFRHPCEYTTAPNITFLGMSLF